MPVENFIAGYRGGAQARTDRNTRRVMQRAANAFASRDERGLEDTERMAWETGDPDLVDWLRRRRAQLTAGWRAGAVARPGQTNAFAGAPPTLPRQPVMPPGVPQAPQAVAPQVPTPPAPQATPPAPQAEAKPDMAKQSIGGAPNPVGSTIGAMVGRQGARSPLIDLPQIPAVTSVDPTTNEPWQLGARIRVNGTVLELGRLADGQLGWRDIARPEAQQDAAASAAPSAAPSDNATPQAAANDPAQVDLTQAALKVAPPVLSQHTQQLMAMRDAYAEMGFVDEVGELDTAIYEAQDRAMELFGARISQLAAFVPILRAIPPAQRAQQALALLQSNPYANDIDGRPALNNEAIQLVQSAARDGQITDQELDQFEQITLTFADRLDQQFRERQLSMQGSDRPLTNSERRVMAQQYRTEVRRTIDELGILRPALPYARLALAHNGDTTNTPGVNFRQSDVALLRAAARAQTGPGVLTESEVWSTLSPSLQQQLTSGMAYLDVSRSGISAPDRAALAQFVMQSAGNVQRDAWDIYEAYEAQYGSDVLAQNGVSPPRIPHPDDEPYLQAQEAQNPERGSFWSINDRTYRYDGPGNWVIMNGENTITDPHAITAEPTDPGQQALTSEQQRVIFAAIRQRRASGNLIASMRRTWREASNQEAMRAALHAAIDEGLLTEREYRDITGQAPQREPNWRGGPRL